MENGVLSGVADRLYEISLGAKTISSVVDRRWTILAPSSALLDQLAIVSRPAVYVVCARP